MAKQKPFIIKTPFPTEEEVMEELGLSEKDVKRVKKILEDIWLKKEAKRKKKRKKKK